MKIILDTNIWIDISKDSELEEKVKHLPLCLTCLVLLEIIYNPLRRLSKNEINNVLLLIKRLKPIYISDYPAQYLCRNLLDLIKPNFVVLNLDLVIEGYLKSTNLNYDLALKLKRFKSDFADLFNTKIKETHIRNDVMKDIKEPNKTYKYVLEDTIKYIELECDIDRKNSNILSLNRNKNMIEAYLIAATYYYSSIFKKPTNTLQRPKAQKNDMVDLYNFMYVNCEDLCWTRDKVFVNRYFKDNDGNLFPDIAAYLFDENDI